ncbi:syntaxin-12-like isoform X2 [Paramacrobiotus metropolitanus]|uniref:syntaxin-12-like isoform X2 n=1 Tax=Paramacrobiotus metropolitanus TaxID=2943436 RepID=UPI002446021C|nr:syntaxin-12-like isoform X2 [Paramacrobiotus metropolitanus]
MGSIRDYGTGSGVSSSAAFRMDFSRLSQTVGSNIQKMSSQVSDVERMVRQIGTASDSTDMRERLHNQTHLIHNIAQDTGDKLKEMSNLPPAMGQSEQRQQKLIKEKLVQQFTDALNRFQTAQRQAAEKERQSFVRARAHSNNAASQWHPFEDDSQRGYGQQSAVPQSQTTVQVEQEVDLQGLREREDAIRKLEADISDVNQIFKDLAIMVHEQGEIIDNIEAHVDSATVNVQHATQELNTARKYQSKSRRKTAILVIILIVIVLIIILSVSLSR